MELNLLKQQIINFEDNYSKVADMVDDIDKLRAELEALENNEQRKDHLDFLLERIIQIKCENDYLMYLLKYTLPEFKVYIPNPTPKNPNYADVIDYELFEIGSNDLYFYQKNIETELLKLQSNNLKGVGESQEITSETGIVNLENNDATDFKGSEELSNDASFFKSQKRKVNIVYSPEHIQRKHILQLVLSTAVKENWIDNNNDTNIGKAIFFLMGQKVSSPDKIRQSISARKNGKKKYNKQIFEKAIENLTNILNEIKREQDKLYPVE